MATTPRIVAELGRPETADETAARKAESSRIYRSSQNTRNLVAALLATLVIVAVIVFAVPRGSLPEAAPIDVAEVAKGIQSAQGGTVLVPAVPATWTVNQAGLESDSPREWTIIYVPGEDNGFVSVVQGFGADAAWPTRVLNGAAVDSTVQIGGVEWQTYDIPDPSKAGNVSVALSTTAGNDTVMVYGKTDQASLEQAAASVADQIRSIREETP